MAADSERCSVSADTTGHSPTSWTRPAVGLLRWTVAAGYSHSLMLGDCSPVESMNRPEEELEVVGIATSMGLGGNAGESRGHVLEEYCIVAWFLNSYVAGALGAGKSAVAADKDQTLAYSLVER